MHRQCKRPEATPSTLLGAIIEKASGNNYAGFMAQDLFEPLGTRDTAYEGHERHPATRAVGHTPAANGFVASAPISMNQPHAAGALVSTVDDLALLDQAISAGKLLAPASWQKMVTPYRLSDGTSSPYADGFDTSPLLGSAAISHGGSITGFSTYALRLPDQKIYVAVLSNADSGLIAPGQVANYIA